MSKIIWNEEIKMVVYHQLLELLKTSDIPDKLWSSNLNTGRRLRQSIAVNKLFVKAQNIAFKNGWVLGGYRTAISYQEAAVIGELFESHYGELYEKVLMLKKPGYHVTKINQGVYGELSKVYEEIEELKDADAQGAKVMVLNELADVIGAIEGYLTTAYPSLTLDDLLTMKTLTARAFASGSRS